jgi:hypothetical protein
MQKIESKHKELKWNYGLGEFSALIIDGKLSSFCASESTCLKGINTENIEFLEALSGCIPELLAELKPTKRIYKSKKKR